MEIITMIFIAIGLSMDAFAVSITTGITIKKLKISHAAKTGLFFGGFQAIMPVIGWFAGKTVSMYIEKYDHWVAFVLLAVIGIKMVWESFFHDKEDKGENKNKDKSPTDTGYLFLLALATSIDALAVGISLAVINANIIVSALLIGFITFAISFFGVLLGKKLGSVFQSWSEFAGGLVLVLIGLKILLEHLGIINF